MMRKKNLLALLASLALIVFAVTGLAPAYAATPAGTVIGNAATATYRDDDNNEYTTTSNIVQSVVLAICGVDVTPSGAMNYQAIPGQTVYVPITVTNTGNSLNIFTVGLGGFTYSGNVYVDENGNGLVDPGEPLVGAGVELNMGETKELLIALVVPPTATPPTSDTGTVTVTGTAPAGCSDTTGNITVNVVNDAVIMATKDVDRDTSVPGGTLNYTIRFKNMGTKQAYSRVDAYSVDVNNDGGLNADVDGILVYDQIPAGTSYNAGTASGAPSSTSVLWFTRQTAQTGGGQRAMCPAARQPSAMSATFCRTTTGTARPIPLMQSPSRFLMLISREAFPMRLLLTIPL